MAPPSTHPLPSRRSGSVGYVARRSGSVGDVARFSDVLDVRPTDSDCFMAPAAGVHGRPSLFGGRVAAQALRAAALTVVGGDRPPRPHSFHCYFVRPGRIDEPLELRVTRVRDGRSFTTRRVGAFQGAHEILSAMVSFQREEEGGEFSTAPALPPDDPETLEPVQMGDWESEAELRLLPGQALGDGAPFPEVLRYWARLPGPHVSGDPVAEACGVAFISDMRAGGAALVAERATFGPATSLGPDPGHESPAGEAPAPEREDAGRPGRRSGMIASLDHAIWFHRRGDPTNWLLFTVRPVANTSSRGLVLGTVHGPDGSHVASFTQELVVRSSRGPAAAVT